MYDLPTILYHIAFVYFVSVWYFDTYKNAHYNVLHLLQICHKKNRLVSRQSIFRSDFLDMEIIAGGQSLIKVETYHLFSYYFLIYNKSMSFNFYY